MAPTDATIEMNCARSEITAIAGSSNAANASFPVTRHQCKTVDGFASAILGVLAGLIADRVELALDWGYPSFDEALFADDLPAQSKTRRKSHRCSQSDLTIATTVAQLSSCLFQVTNG